MCMSFPPCEPTLAAPACRPGAAVAAPFSFLSRVDEEITRPRELAESSTPTPAATSAAAADPCSTGRPGEARDAICE
jgi:hypothetical protein